MKPTTLAGLLAASLAFSLPITLYAVEQDLEGLRQKLASPDYEIRKSVVTELLHIGEKRPLKKEEIDLLLPHLKSDADWRIKVRVTAVLPYAVNPDWVLQPLVFALRDRDEKSSGGGNVPSYACGALARLGDSRGLEPSEEWLSYLESHPRVYDNLHDDCVKLAQKRIAELKAKLATKGSKSVEPTPTR